jgi:hypothetical protein
VQRCFSIASTTGLELEARDQHERAAVPHAVFSTLDRPKTWNSGSTGDADVVVAEAEQLTRRPCSS